MVRHTVGKFPFFSFQNAKGDRYNLSILEQEWDSLQVEPLQPRTASLVGTVVHKRTSPVPEHVPQPRESATRASEHHRGNLPGHHVGERARGGGADV